VEAAQGGVALACRGGRPGDVLEAGVGPGARGRERTRGGGAKQGRWAAGELGQVGWRPRTERLASGARAGAGACWRGQASKLRCELGRLELGRARAEEDGVDLHEMGRAGFSRTWAGFSRCSGFSRSEVRL
jgi:hypothetical protein